MKGNTKYRLVDPIHRLKGLPIMFLIMTRLRYEEHETYRDITHN